MKNIKFEFDKLKVTQPTDKQLKITNRKSETGEKMTVEEAITFWRPTHDIETLNFSGQNGWEIKAVANKETKEGDIDIYFLQRNSEHPNFGKMTLREEYQQSELYKKHTEQWKKLIK